MIKFSLERVAIDGSCHTEFQMRLIKSIPTCLMHNIALTSVRHISNSQEYIHSESSTYHRFVTFGVITHIILRQVCVFICG